MAPLPWIGGLLRHEQHSLAVACASAARGAGGFVVASVTALKAARVQRRENCDGVPGPGLHYPRHRPSWKGHMGTCSNQRPLPTNSLPDDFLFTSKQFCSIPFAERNRKTVWLPLWGAEHNIFAFSLNLHVFGPSPMWICILSTFLPVERLTGSQTSAVSN